MSKKIKVLVVPSDRTGVSYFRSTNPHLYLGKMYPDEFHVDIEYAPQLDNDEWLKQYDVIHYHRTLGSYEMMEQLVAKLKSLGIVSIMDIDDYWAPGPHHPAYLIIKNNELDKKIVNNLKVAEHVSTTTQIYADEISKYNKNVHIFPNGIDPKEKQFTPKPVKSDRVRIGWLGGSSHLKDLEILKGLVGKLKSDGLMDKVQFVLCGYDLRGMVTMIDQKTGQQTQRKITPKESVWYKYEQIFTSDYSTVSPEYKEHLLRFTKTEFEGIENEPYRRVWTKPISSYASNYNLFDISLAPLEENKFNQMKSQLKVIEAGFHKKAIIAQNFGPYQIDLTGAYGKPVSKKAKPTFDETANAYLIDSSKNHKDWYKHVKTLITQPEKIKILADNLHETISTTYSLDTITKNRRKLYKDLVSKVKKP
jgi:glycosyltransferase involved in cell wall biosynthesis